MKQEVDRLVAKDDQIQHFLAWVEQKSSSVKVSYKPAAIRAFYFALDLDRDRDRDRALDRALVLALALDPELKRSLQTLRDQLPDLSHGNKGQFKQWWQTNGTAWAEQLRTVMVQHRNIGHDWQFSPEQNDLLNQYYNANKLLVDCLNSDCYVSREVRQEIETGLLLPRRS